MKYYSEKTKKFYDSAADCEKEEAAIVKAEAEKTAARKADAENVEKARKELDEARKAFHAAYENYNKTLSDFCKKHGAYHTTVKNTKDLDGWFPLIDLFNAL